MNAGGQQGSEGNAGGQQGSEVNAGGKAGGDIYGGVISYFPTNDWNMNFSVDRLRNISNITSGALQGLGGLELSAVGISASESIQATVITYRTNYIFSKQTSAYLEVSDTLIQDLSGPPMLEQSWLAAVGVRR